MNRLFLSRAISLTTRERKVGWNGVHKPKLSKPESSTAALGFRVKSGWATVVLLGGTSALPRVLDRRIIDLCDPAIPDSRQPWHAAEGKSVKEGVQIVEKLRKLVMEVADKNVSRLIKEYKQEGYKLLGAGVVVGSNVDPFTLKNEHIRAHALEGQLFRLAVCESVADIGLRYRIVVERSALSDASSTLKKPPDYLKRVVSGFRDSVEGSWRSEEKNACLSAWMFLRK
jgi:hypothetical protein